MTSNLIESNVAELGAWKDKAVENRVANFDEHMSRCLRLAEVAGCDGDVPVGALVLDAAGNVISEGFNTRERDNDPAGHAEINALRRASRHLGTSHLDGCTLIVTLEPCTMCAGAILLSRISTLVFGAWEPKTGACGSLRDVVRDVRATHQVEVIGGVRAEECSAQLSAFFAERRMEVME